MILLNKSVNDYNLHGNYLFYDLKRTKLVFFCFEIKSYSTIEKFWKLTQITKIRNKLIVYDVSNLRYLLFIKFKTNNPEGKEGYINKILSQYRDKNQSDFIRILKEEELEVAFFYFLEKKHINKYNFQFIKEREFIKLNYGIEQSISYLYKINFENLKFSPKNIQKINQYAQLRKMKVFFLLSSKSDEIFDISCILIANNIENLEIFIEFLVSINKYYIKNKSKFNRNDLKKFFTKKQFSSTIQKNINIALIALEKSVFIENMKNKKNRDKESQFNLEIVKNNDLTRFLRRNNIKYSKLENFYYIKSLNALILILETLNPEIIYKFLEKYYKKYQFLFILFKISKLENLLVNNTRIKKLKKVFIYNFDNLNDFTMKLKKLEIYQEENLIFNN